MREGVGGATGFVFRVLDDKAEVEGAVAVVDWTSARVVAGVKGSLLISGKDSYEAASGSRNSIDLTKTT